MAMLVITRGYMNSRTFGRLLPSTYKRCLHWLIEGCFNDFVPTNRLSNAQWKRRNRTLQSAIALPVHQDCICILATKGRNATSATILKYGSKDVPTSAKLFVSTMISQVAHIEHVHYYLTIYCIIYVSTVQYKYIYIYLITYRYHVFVDIQWYIHIYTPRKSKDYWKKTVSPC